MEEVKDYITEEEHDRVEVMMRLCIRKRVTVTDDHRR